MDDGTSGNDGGQRLVTRQEFLRIGGLMGLGTLAAACAPTAAPAPAPAAPAPAAGAAAWEREWNELVAAAEKEGKVAFTTNVGPGYRKWVDTFQAAFPKITVQHEGLNIFPFLPKLLAERKADLYNWDLLLTAPPVMHLQLKPHGALAPIRPLFVRPDVLDDKAWRGGFEAGFADADKKLGFSFMERVLPIIVNTDLVKEGEIKTVQDLLNPKWKGKILWGDVRDGATFGQMTPVRLKHGDEVVKRLMVDQQPTFSRDIRQMMELTIRGQYAITNSNSRSFYQEFIQQGVGKNLKFLDIPDLSYLTLSDGLWLVDRAPHPNAAKVFANWVATRAGQESYVRLVEQNSRRLDVPEADPLEAPKPGQAYFRLGSEEAIAEVSKTQQLLNELVGIRN